MSIKQLHTQAKDTSLLRCSKKFLHVPFQYFAGMLIVMHWVSGWHLEANASNPAVSV